MPKHVLIVDNQRGDSRLLRSALETIEQGLAVSEAQSGEEASLELIGNSIDLLVVDSRLPGISGLELIKKFRVMNPQGRVIMTSGLSEDPRLFKQATEANVDALFPKPVPTGDFLDAVETCLGLARTIVHPNKAEDFAPNVSFERKSLGELLVNLRKDLQATAVLLLNDSGQVVAEAGQISDAQGAGPLISAMMNLFSAAQKAASQIDHTQSHLHLFTGEDQDGIFLPVGTQHAMILTGKGLAKPYSIAARLELLDQVRLELLDTLARVLMGDFSISQEIENARKESGVETQLQTPITSGPAECQTEELSNDFLNILDQADSESFDANSFWDSAVEKGTIYLEPDKLTYEQASRLGLAPDSAQDK